MDVSFDKTAGNDVWLTPPYILKALGEFDLDPCAPIIRPWDMAKNHFTELDNGLMKDWEGRVFCNPPYGKETKYWFNKCAMHGNVIALTFARTETGMFFTHVWNVAYAVFFIKGRVRFYDKNGVIPKKGGPGSPSVLIAFDRANSEILRTCSLKGKFIQLK